MRLIRASDSPRIYSLTFVFLNEMDYSFAPEFRPTVALINKQS